MPLRIDSLPARCALAAVALLLAAACSGDADRDALLERVDAWTTEDSRFIVQRARNARDTGGNEFVEEASDFVDRDPTAAIWPHELPGGFELRVALLLVVPDTPPSLNATFVDEEGAFALNWRVFASAQQDPDVPDEIVAERGGVFLIDETGEFVRWSLRASACGYTLLAVVLSESPLTVDESLGAAAGVLGTCEE